MGERVRNQEIHMWHLPCHNVNLSVIQPNHLFPFQNEYGWNGASSIRKTTLEAEVEIFPVNILLLLSEIDINGIPGFLKPTKR